MSTAADFPFIELIKQGPALTIVAVMVWLLIQRDKQVDQLTDAVKDLITAVELQRQNCTNSVQRIVEHIDALKDRKD